MSTQYRLIRALRCATVALFLAACVEGFKELIPSNPSAWQSHVAAIVLCASIVFLLNFGLLCRNQLHPNLLKAEASFPEYMLDGLPEIACTFDDAGRFRKRNSNCEAAPGCTAREIAEIAAADTIVSGIAVDLRKTRQVEKGLQASGEQYQTLVASIPEVVWEVDREGNVAFVSPQAESLLGYSVAEVGRKQAPIWFDSIHVDDRQRVKQALEALFDGGRPYDVEYRAQRKNGEWFWAHDRAVATSDRNGGRVATGLLSDITERKQAEETLVRLASIVEFSEDAIISETTEGVITSWNRAAENMYGYTKTEALGRNLSFLVTPERQDEIRALLERVQTGNVVECIETQRVTKWGSVLDVSLSLSPIKDGSGQVAGASAIARDITPRKRAEEQLRLQSAALEAAANAIVITDFQGTIMWVNYAFTKMTGYSKAEALGNNPRLLKSEEQPEGYYAKLWSTISSGKVWQGEIVNRRKDGTTYTEEMTITPVTRDVRNPANRYFIAIKQDITERKRAEEELYRAHQMLQTILDTIPQRVFWKDRNCTYQGCNRIFATDAGLDNPAEIVGKSDFDLAWSETAEVYRADDQLVMEQGSAKLGYEEIQDRPDGSRVWLRTSKLPRRDQEGKVTGVIGTYEDITERKQAEQALRTSEKRYRLLFERNMAGVFRTTLEGRVLECNHAAARLFGYDSPEEVLAVPVTSLYHTASDREAFVRKLKSEKSLTNHEIRFRRKNGDSAWVIGNISLVDDHSGEGGIIEGTLIDITERKVAEERAQYLAYYDALTGLPNRTLLQDRLTKALASARRRKDKVALLFLDLDRFKIINDSLGHSAGDHLLQEVAERLKKCAREQDTVARAGGDEFLIVLNAVKDVADAAVAAQRFVNSVTREFVVQDRTLSIDCSVGISIFPEHGTDSETLIKNADAALHCAQENGRHTFGFFTQDMNVQVVERLTLESSLRLALEKEEFFLVYQPQMNIVTGRITGLEALLRWQHPELGLIPPDKFIRIAENSGLIMPIGEWVLRTACRQARKWHDEGLLAVPVAVNVSAVQFRQEGFCELIKRVLHETSLAPQYLDLELTESLLLSNADVTFSVLQELKAMGLKLAIDDFGTGYSSLSYLKHFPVGKLKIDRSFIRDVAVNPDDAAITTAIISMAKSLNLLVIAEGVENEAQMSFLRTHHCDEIQGYYFSKPLTVDAAADKLRGAAGHALSANQGA